MDFKKFNRANARRFNFDAKGNQFTNLRKLWDMDKGGEKSYIVRACYINKRGHYGDEPMCITDGWNINLPKHLLKVIKDILSDDDAVETINEGKALFQIREYENESGKHYTIEFV